MTELSEKAMKMTTRANDRLISRRRDFESRFDDLRRSLDRELGWAPSGKTWLMPLAAFATGVALAAWLVAKRRATGAEEAAGTDGDPGES